MRVIDFFDRAVSWFADRPCLLDREHSWTYQEVRSASSALAGAIKSKLDDAETPARIAVLSPNCAEGLVTILAVFRIGAIWIPVNAKMSAEDIGRFLALTRCQLLLSHHDLSDLAARAANVGGCPVLLLPDIDALTPCDAGPSPAPWSMDDMATLFSTGGTTGEPKAAMWTHRTWATQFANFHAGVRHQGHPVYLAATPITHAAGLVAFYMFAVGATIIIVDRADPAQVMESIETHRVTTLFLPPTVIYMMLAHPDVHRRNFSSLQNMIYAAAPMSVEKLRQAMKAFGPVMVQTFGQAEAPMVCTILTREDHVTALERSDESRLASCGRPGLLTQVTIVDACGRPVPVGTVGEIAVKGDLLMAGYFENPEATAECRLAGGWQGTGDIGVIDAEGFLSITDRKRDMIITGGFNVYPSSIEQVLWSHDAVQDCAVVGCPDEKWGEAVVGVVELKPGKTCDAKTLIALCKDRLGSVHAPKRIEFLDELPRSAVGKVLKRTIRDHYWTSQSRKI